MWRSIGSTKASVLPLPVLATPMQSRPLMMMGSACACGSGQTKKIIVSQKPTDLLQRHCANVCFAMLVLQGWQQDHAPTCGSKHS